MVVALAHRFYWGNGAIQSNVSNVAEELLNQRSDVLAKYGWRCPSEEG